jgi:hypothetical protein
VLLTAPAQHWDATNQPLFRISLLAIYALPLLLLALLFILFSSRISFREKLFAGTVGGLATIAQIVAAIPLIQ